MQGKATPVEVVMGALSKVLGINSYSAQLQNLAARIEKLKPESKVSLVKVCQTGLQDSIVSKAEILRVACSKVLVALLPNSLPTIKALLSSDHGAVAYEVHFSLFCALSEVPNVSQLYQCKTLILELTKEYLMMTKTLTGQAAWMAAELLGGDWELDESFQILKLVANDGSYVAGRWATVFGLSRALPRASEAMRTEILLTLKEMSKEDRSKRIRSFAKRAIEEFEESNQATTKWN